MPVVITTTKEDMQERFKTFTILVSNINRCIHKIKTEEMADFNLKSSHVSCLYYIYKENSLTAKELCGLCGEDKANISRTIKFLEGNRGSMLLILTLTIDFWICLPRQRKQKQR